MVLMTTMSSECRQRLSNDSFSLFLQAIKELNSGKKTREDTLHTANDIFGSGNGDLFGEHTVLSRLQSPAYLLPLNKEPKYFGVCSNIKDMRNSISRA